MKAYKPDKTDIVGKIKQQVEKFILSSNVINSETKQALIEELGTNHHDNRFDAGKFIPDAIGYSVEVWREQKFNIAQLWKDVAVNAASGNRYPHAIANDVIEEFEKKFVNIEK